MTQSTLRLQALRRTVAQRAMRLTFGAGRSHTPGSDTLPRAGIHRILICRSVRNLRDSLTLTPLLQELGRTWPGAEIDLVSNCPVAEEIYGACFGIGRIIRFPAHPLGRPIRTAQALWQMRNVRYDLAIDPGPRSPSGRLLIVLARKKHSLGFRGSYPSGKMTSAAEPSEATGHQTQSPVFLLRSALGERSDVRPCPRPDLRLTAIERQQGRDAVARLLAQQPQIVRGCIGLFTDSTGDRRFDATWWFRFVAVFKPGMVDYALIEVLSAASVRSQLNPYHPCFYSRHLRKLASVLANFSFLVSADCGVMHLGGAVGVPTVGVFRVTAPPERDPCDGANLAIDARKLSPEQAAEKVLDALQTLGTIPQ